VGHADSACSAVQRSARRGEFVFSKLNFNFKTQSALPRKDEPDYDDDAPPSHNDRLGEQDRSSCVLSFRFKCDVYV
jgi:hypothetical protein